MAAMAWGYRRTGRFPRMKGGLAGDCVSSSFHSAIRATALPCTGLLLTPSPAMAATGAGANTLPMSGLLLLCGLLAVLLVVAFRRLRAVHRAHDEALMRATLAETAQARAEEESRAKSRFMAEMSHELRTPLNTVMGFSEMMAQEVLGPHLVPSYAGYARDIHASGRHLLSLADDMLDLARIESGHRILLETPVRLDHLGQDCLAMMQPEAQRRHLHLARTTEMVQIWGDERALRQITLNLLTNAVKFTPAGGEVQLQAGMDAEGRPYLAVADTGAGIASHELPLESSHHHESRLDVSTGRGAGLGLAIVRGLAHLHGGTLTLTRRAGGGTLAWVSLPESRLMPASALMRPAPRPECPVQAEEAPCPRAPCPPLGEPRAVA